MLYTYLSLYIYVCVCVYIYIYMIAPRGDRYLDVVATHRSRAPRIRLQTPAMDATTSVILATSTEGQACASANRRPMCV